MSCLSGIHTVYSLPQPIKLSHLSVDDYLLMSAPPPANSLISGTAHEEKLLAWKMKHIKHISKPDILLGKSIGGHF